MRLVAGDRRARDTDVRDAVAYFTPDDPVATRPVPGTFEIRTHDKSFSPRVLVVPVGSTVRFPNDDPILHNVFSVSRGNAFDVGVYGPGDGASHTFTVPGLVRVFCNVHHDMAAYIVVLDTPYVARPDADGSFRLGGLPAGPGTLTVWHERGEPWTGAVVLPQAAPARVEIVVRGRRVPSHLDKRGRPYGARERERYD